MRVRENDELATGLKMTDLGPLPEEWQVVRLGDLLENGVLLIRNGFPQGEHNISGQGVPHLRPFNISSDGYIDLGQNKYVGSPSADSPYWLQKDDIIFNNTNSEELVGKTAYFSLDGRYVLSNHMTFIRVLDPKKVNAYWLAKHLHWLWMQGVFRALCRRHVNQASVSLERLKGVVIPLPPLPEQRAIAHVLSTIQRAIEATERVIAAARELKKSLMRHLFTYGPVPPAEAESVPLKETEIGPLPVHWQVVRFGTAFIGTAQVPKVKRSDYATAGAIPILDQGQNFIAGFTDALEPYRSPLPVILFGDHTRVFKFINFPFVVGADGTKVLVPNYNKFDPQFLFYAASRLEIPNRGYNRHFHLLREQLFPVPPLPEQQRIAEILQAVDAKIQAEEQRKAALQSLFRSMLHHLMTGRVRVPLPLVERYKERR